MAPASIRMVGRGLLGRLFAGHELRVTVPAIDVAVAAAVHADTLEPIVQAVGDRAQVILDGGIRRGTDIVKALAVGARAVGIGRAYLYGLAAAGEAGVARAISILAEELRRDLALMGYTDLKSIRRDNVLAPHATRQNN